MLSNILNGKFVGKIMQKLSANIIWIRMLLYNIRCGSIAINCLYKALWNWKNWQRTTNKIKKSKIRKKKNIGCW
jgi:hypothetical protein